MFAFPRHRPLLAWTLCLGVLLSAHLCGLQHGQASGLTLSGLGAAFCSPSGATLGDGGPADVESPSSLSCPLCQSPGISNAALLVAGLPAARRAPGAARRSDGQAPRRRWPRANPRAP